MNIPVIAKWIDIRIKLDTQTVRYQFDTFILNDSQRHDVQVLDFFIAAS